VITTDWVDVTAAVVAVNVTDVDPARIVTDAGTVAAVELSDRLTTAPPDGAAADSVTVQVLDTPPITLPGAHPMEERVIAEEGATVTVVVCDRPL
jgi:hypothetical protein